MTANPTDRPLQTTRDNGIDMGGGERGVMRIVHDGYTDVAYCPHTDGDGGNAHAAELVRRWNAFPLLLAACERAAEAMRMQEQRESGAFHVSADAFRPLWLGVTADLRAVLEAVGGKIPEQLEAA